MKHKIFISYSHKDTDAVTKFAQRLSLCGFDLWIDEKNIETGSNYATKIFTGIYDSDVYMVFISAHSVNSAWVQAEIDFALTRKIESGKLRIVPVKLDDTQMPVSLQNLDFLDARFSVSEAAAQYAEKYQGMGMNAASPQYITIANIGFAISDTTDVEVGPLSGEFTLDDVEENRTNILEKMRKNAYGILMNFVSVSDFDFTAVTPKFMNGIYTEKVEKVAGSTAGSIREKITIETTVFHPDEYKVYRLLSDRLDILKTKINGITFGFVIPLNEGEKLRDVGIRCLQKIQDKYTILSYDHIEGVRIEVSDGFYLSFCVAEETVKIKLSTKYDFQFADRMREFSVLDFLHSLLEQ